MKSTGLLVNLLLFYHWSGLIYAQSHEKRLINDLIGSPPSCCTGGSASPTSSVKARPRTTSSNVVSVRVVLELRQIVALDEVNQVLYTSGFIVAFWTDDSLKWNPAAYGGIQNLIVPPSQIWLPDFGIVNSAGTFYDSSYNTDFRVHIDSDGSVAWAFGGNFATSCGLDLTFFPFDKQSCDFSVENWAYPSSQVELSNASTKVILDDFQPNGEWDMVGSAVEKTYIHHDIYPNLAFPKVTFKIRLQRKPDYYGLNILTPCMLILALALMMFWLPCDSGEKVSLGITVLLAYSVFQLVIADNTAKTSDFNPVLSLYVTSVMSLACISTMVSILVLYLHHHLPSSQVPKGVRVFFFKYVAYVLCMRASVPNTDSGNHVAPQINLLWLDILLQCVSEDFFLLL